MWKALRIKSASKGRTPTWNTVQQMEARRLPIRFTVAHFRLEPMESRWRLHVQSDSHARPVLRRRGFTVPVREPIHLIFSIKVVEDIVHSSVHSGPALLQYCTWTVYSLSNLACILYTSTPRYCTMHIIIPVVWVGLAQWLLRCLRPAAQ
jgi:hypothetical protein